jgi:hypothetical protein
MNRVCSRDAFMSISFHYGTILTWEASADLGDFPGFILAGQSIQTTERHLGSEQEIAVAVNDNLGL